MNMKPHPWLPDKTSLGENPVCDNCRYRAECELKHDGWICGNWEEADEYQIQMFGGK